MINSISRHLLASGIKPSFQRIKIYEYLTHHKNHPTVEMIYSQLVKEIPTFSKTTVYNTLELFIEKGITSLITIDEKETRYDADTSVHSHFKCVQCSEIYDIRADMNQIHIPGLNEHRVTEHHLYFKGTCKSCLQSSSPSH